jgi:hypothetical protein
MRDRFTQLLAGRDAAIVERDKALRIHNAASATPNAATPKSAANNAPKKKKGAEKQPRTVAEQAANKAAAMVNNMSRDLGELAAEVYVKKKWPGPPEPKKLHPKQNAEKPIDSKSGEFDQIWEVTEDDRTRLVVVEAKGGKSPLQPRMAGKLRVEQGTRQYFEEIVKLMQKPKPGKDEDIIKLGQRLAQHPEGVRYIQVRFGIELDDLGRSVGSGITAGEFNLAQK